MFIQSCYCKLITYVTYTQRNDDEIKWEIFEGKTENLVADPESYEMYIQRRNDKRQKDIQIKSNTSITEKFNSVVEVEDSFSYDRFVILKSSINDSSNM